ncbi:MAG: T9SS type A sorting domain-containing protein, partial [Bacteroidota bacterium]
PNPTRGRFTIEVPTTTAPTHLSIFGTDGRLVSALTVPTGAVTQEIELTGQPAGVYQLRWLSPEGQPHLGRVVVH